MSSRIKLYGAAGFLDVAVRFEAMARRAEDTSPAWRRWGDDVSAAFREQFLTEGVRLIRQVWAPLSPQYRAWKERHFPGQTILRRTDRMMRDFTIRPLDIERVDRNSGTFGSGRKPAIFHQKGTRKMPARPIARVTEDLTASAKRLLVRHIVHGDLP